MRNSRKQTGALEEYEQIRQVSAAAEPEAGRLPRHSRRRRRRRAPLLLLLALAAGGAAGLGAGYCVWGVKPAASVDLKTLEPPAWVKQELLRKNIFSRPDVTMYQVNNIVIHYVANPGATAEANRNYFDSLADQDPQQPGSSASSHFIVGLEGEVIQCIPLDEIAYANAPRNMDTVSIEVCHPDESGVFDDASYQSLVRLTAWLCGELKLSPDDVIRHYDVSGKNCPKYYVEHEDAWKQLRKDIKAAMS